MRQRWNLQDKLSDIPDFTLLCVHIDSLFEPQIYGHIFFSVITPRVTLTGQLYYKQYFMKHTNT